MEIQKLILASASPRRRELLSQIGISYEVIPSKKEEVVTGRIPSEVVQELAKQKAEDIAGQISEAGLVLGADTVVVRDEAIIGKPRSEEEAFQILEGLQGRMHQVYTGVALSLRKSDGTIETTTFYEATDVVVFPMSREEMLAYIATGEPMDKAGAYGIQGAFAAYIKEIHGDYNNVVGLPVGRVYQEIKMLKSCCKSPLDVVNY